jgi:hypothetical protein
MAQEQFNFAVTAIIIVTLAGIMLVTFSLSQQNLDSEIIRGLRSVSLTNVTTYSYDGQNVDAGRIKNGTPISIRDTPEFTCNKFFIYENSTGIGLSANTMQLRCNGSVTAGSTEALYFTSDGTRYNSTHGVYSAGTVMLILAGNSSNASARLGRGFAFNISYTAKTYEASWNVTKDLQQGYAEGGTTHAQYYILIILSIVIGIGLLLVGFRYGTGGSEGSGFGGSLGSGGSNVLDSFKR